VVPFGRRTGELHGCHPHGTPDAARPEHHHPLPPKARDLLDRLDHALAVVVVAAKATVLDRDEVRGADRPHILVDLIKQRDHRDFPRHGDAEAPVPERPQPRDGQREVGFVRHVALPELPVQAVVGVDRVEHAVDGILGDRMAEHPGHLLLGRDRGHEGERRCRRSDRVNRCMVRGA
jgi:hypothetical protein